MTRSRVTRCHVAAHARARGSSRGAALRMGAYLAALMKAFHEKSVPTPRVKNMMYLGGLWDEDRRVGGGSHARTGKQSLNEARAWAHGGASAGWCCSDRRLRALHSRQVVRVVRRVPLAQSVLGGEAHDGARPPSHSPPGGRCRDRDAMGGRPADGAFAGSPSALKST